MTLCGICQTRKLGAGNASGYCHVCFRVNSDKIPHDLTAEQQAYVWTNHGKMTVRKIAQGLGIGMDRLLRFKKQAGICRARNSYLKVPGLIDEVISYYEEHGRKATIEKFPDIKVLNIINEYPVRVRQVRWSEKDIVRLAQVAGLMSAHKQILLLEHATAKAENLSQFMARLGWRNASHLHGLKEDIARYILKPGYPVVIIDKTHPFRPEVRRHRDRRVLWCEMGAHLRLGMPAFVHETVEVMTQFQMWLYAPEHPSVAIRALIAQGAALNIPASAKTVSRPVRPGRRGQASRRR